MIMIKNNREQLSLKALWPHRPASRPEWSPSFSRTRLYPQR